MFIVPAILKLCEAFLCSQVLAYHPTLPSRPRASCSVLGVREGTVGCGAYARACDARESDRATLSVAGGQAARDRGRQSGRRQGRPRAELDAGKRLASSGTGVSSPDSRGTIGRYAGCELTEGQRSDHGARGRKRPERYGKVASRPELGLVLDERRIDQVGRQTPREASDPRIGLLPAS